MITFIVPPDAVFFTRQPALKIMDLHPRIYHCQVPAGLCPAHSALAISTTGFN
jgi:hypothetical protein